ncbi:hypothetical protein [Ferruginibacter sp.]|nr:hypothetical protein [Ferruginibacter sp.]
MKPVLTTTIKKAVQQLLVTTCILIMLLIPVGLFAQADSTKAEVPAAEEVKEESSLISPSIEFLSVQKADKSIDLKAALKAKVKGAFIKLPLLKVTFISVNDTEEKQLGFAITDQNGKVVFNVKGDSLIANKEGKVHFKAVFAGNKQMDPAEEEVTIKRARLEITPVKGDSLSTVQIRLIDMGTGTETPVPEITLGVFVQRLFNPLKLGEGATDENGETSVEIANNLPGDAKGNITLMAKLDENEVYGNLEAASVQKWGIPVSDKIENQPRALWSSHPPLWMLITFFILMIVVWGHYIVIVYQLVKLRKEEPHAPTTVINS